MGYRRKKVCILNLNGEVIENFDTIRDLLTHAKHPAKLDLVKLNALRDGNVVKIKNYLVVYQKHADKHKNNPNLKYIFNKKLKKKHNRTQYLWNKRRDRIMLLDKYYSPLSIINGKITNICGFYQMNNNAIKTQLHRNPTRIFNYVVQGYTPISDIHFLYYGDFLALKNSLKKYMFPHINDRFKNIFAKKVFPIINLPSKN